MDHLVFGLAALALIVVVGGALYRKRARAKKRLDALGDKAKSVADDLNDRLRKSGM